MEQENIKKEKKPEFLTYKDKPLVRKDNVIYYGDMADDYVAMLQISDAKDFSDVKLPSRVTIQIISTDPDEKPQERIKKKTEKPSLYEAINIASIWLERTLEAE